MTKAGVSSFQDLLRWEKICYTLRESQRKYGSAAEKETQAALADFAETKEKIELELQRFQVLLDRSGGITVKVTPDYLGE